MKLRRFLERGLAGGILLWTLAGSSARAQRWDAPSRVGGWLSSATAGKLTIGFESRGRYEHRSGQSFGRDPNLNTALFRHSLSVNFRVTAWLKLSGAVRDSRAPGYGPKAPNSVRDEADVQEAYLELFPDSKPGFGITAGRKALSYGETRLIGTPQWSNVPRTFDHARISWRFAKARVDFLFVSPVKARSGEFNRPVLGDRVWGVYISFPELVRKSLLEVYVLRHDQNAPGGFTGGSRQAGTNKLRLWTCGALASGPLPHSLKYSVEGVLQTGKAGPARHRAAAWASSLTRRWTLGNRSLDLLGEYKYGSGANNPEDTSRSGTFDPIYPASHDKFGHMDLFSWRNIHYARSQVTLAATKSLTLHFMYNSWWLASTRDGLYDASGKSVARSAGGTAGRHVGQGTDVFGTFKLQRFTLGAGYGYMFQGQFVRNTTPGITPTYAYLFHTYSF